MPMDLLEAHRALDMAVEAAYEVDFNGDEEKIVAHLFKLYAGTIKWRETLRFMSTFFKCNIVLHICKRAALRCIWSAAFAVQDLFLLCRLFFTRLAESHRLRAVEG